MKSGGPALAARLLYRLRMFRALAAGFALAVTLPACTDDFEHRTPDLYSHVASYFLPELRPPRLDLLFVLDDTTAMAPWQDRLMQFPPLVEATVGAIYGGTPNVRIAVTTEGTLRGSSLVDDPYLTDEHDWGGPHLGNYRGSLGEALRSMMSVGASRQGPHRPLAAIVPAIEAFARPDAYLAVIAIAAADDESPAAVAEYAAATKGTRQDPSSVVVSGIYTPGLPRLDAFHAEFPNRNDTTPIGSMDWSSAFDLVAQLAKVPLSIACVQQPLDLDPAAAGAQIDCAMEYSLAGTTHALPYCGERQPCWELVEDRQSCVDAEARFVFQVHGFGDPYHPEIRGQCVVK